MKSKNTPLSVWAVFGTRPEAIKMLPLVLAMKNDARFNPTVCITAQHRDILDKVMGVFDVKADIDLNVMKPGQGFTELTARILQGMEDVLTDTPEGVEKPQCVLVHGDTTTTMATTLASYYQQIPVGHVEAGLRTGNKYSPFPEEINRKITGSVADFHFAPTGLSHANLKAEGVDDGAIFVTGNTVIDALLFMRNKLNTQPELAGEMQSFVSDMKARYSRYILVTGHRRESHGGGFDRICDALNAIAESHPDTAIVYPVHPNPNVRGPVHAKLSRSRNIYLIDPQDYAPFIHLMDNAYLILTDSGGIQEEAPSLGKPVLVMRDVTERQEALEAGTVKLVGTDTKKIINEVDTLIRSAAAYEAMAGVKNPYGDGTSCKQILDALATQLGLNVPE